MIASKKMTKSQELKLIDDLILFHPDSYLGEWLKSHRRGIERCIVRDLPLDMVGVVEPIDSEGKPLPAL